MKNREIKFDFFEAAGPQELDPPDRELLEKARQAWQSAYAPYSSYQVGAAVRLVNERVFSGNNQENVSFPAGVCAERVALPSPNPQYPTPPVAAMATVVHNDDNPQSVPASPCGICRQTMVEIESRFDHPFKIILGGDGDRIFVIPRASDLMPLTFSADFLKRL
jgi:cytidine deaminase